MSRVCLSELNMLVQVSWEETLMFFDDKHIKHPTALEVLKRPQAVMLVPVRWLDAILLRSIIWNQVYTWYGLYVPFYYMARCRIGQWWVAVPLPPHLLRPLRASLEGAPWSISIHFQANSSAKSSISRKCAYKGCGKSSRGVPKTVRYPSPFLLWYNTRQIDW